ncbi:MAG: hypothetical protein DRG37_00520 [Deltaproteobacteria bacterium]|nr:MAG: hypothetical protein DRG37_00520 [Deltaproteobacteria bacterium]
MNVLVTGASGFIGSFLVERLLEEGISVRALVLPGEDSGALRQKGVDVYYGDLRVPGDIKGLCKDIDIVYHLAGRVTDWGARSDFYLAIYSATRNLLEESKGKVKTFVYISSIAACGLGRHLLGQKEDDACFKTGVPYGDAKLDTERLAFTYHARRYFDLTVVRPANVIGPGSVWVKDIVDRFNTMFVPLIDHGIHSGSFVYVENLVDGIVLAGTRDISKGRIYHFRDDWDVTWKGYLYDLGAIVGKSPRSNLSFSLAWHLGSFMERILTPMGIRPPITRLAAGAMGRNNDVDTQRARTELGWKTRISYEDAMEKIRNWVSLKLLKGEGHGLD